MKARGGFFCTGRTCKRKPLYTEHELRLIELLESDATLADIKKVAKHVRNFNKFVYGKLPIFLAAANFKDGLIDFLVEKGADTDVQDSNGQTAAHIVGYESLLDLSINDANLDIRDDWGRTPLSYNVSYGLSDSVELLIGIADVNSKDNNGVSILEYVEDADIANMLCKAGAIGPQCDTITESNEGNINIPENATNIIMWNNIQDGDRMINFHTERNKFKRYYKNSNEMKKVLKKGVNPFTKEQIKTIRRYTARRKARASA